MGIFARVVSGGCVVALGAVVACTTEGADDRDGVSDVTETVSADKIKVVDGTPTVSVPSPDGQGCCISRCCVWTGSYYRCTGVEASLEGMVTISHTGDACGVTGDYKVCVDTNCDGIPDNPNCLTAITGAAAAKDKR